jgi:hypothetical protein
MNNVVNLKPNLAAIERAYRKSVRDIALKALQGMEERVSKAGIDNALGFDDPVHTAAGLAMALKDHRLELVVPADPEIEVTQEKQDLYDVAADFEEEVLNVLRDKADQDGNRPRGMALNYAVYFLQALDSHNWVKPLVNAYAAYAASHPTTHG